MNFGVSVIVFLLETIGKVLAWALGLKKDPIQEPNKDLQENIISETVASTDEGLEEKIESNEELQGEHDFKPNNESEKVAANTKQNREQEVSEEDIQEEDQKSNPEVVVTNLILESDKSLDDIESMFSQMNLSSSQNEVIDEESTPNKQAEEQLITPESKIWNKDEENSLFKKMRQQRDKIEGDRSPLLEHPSNQFQDVTPDNKKTTPEDLEESTLLKKLKQQRDKLDTMDSADGTNQIDLKINTFKQAASESVEDALALKLKQQLKKIDDNIEVEEVKTKHETKSLVEDALEEKLKKQQLKIDGFYEAVVESTYHHPAESLVEDALAEKLKKRRSKIDEGVEEIDATLNQKSSITSWEKGGTLDRKLRKQRQKMKEAEMTGQQASDGLKVTEMTDQRASDGGKGTEMTDQRASDGGKGTEMTDQRASDGGKGTEMTDQRASDGGKGTEMTDQRASDGVMEAETTDKQALDGVEKQIQDAMQDIDIDVKFKRMDEDHRSMSSLMENATQVTRTRE